MDMATRFAIKAVVAGLHESKAISDEAVRAIGVALQGAADGIGGPDWNRTDDAASIRRLADEIVADAGLRL